MIKQLNHFCPIFLCTNEGEEVARIHEFRSIYNKIAFCVLMEGKSRAWFHPSSPDYRALMEHYLRRNGVANIDSIQFQIQGKRVFLLDFFSEHPFTAQLFTNSEFASDTGLSFENRDKKFYVGAEKEDDMEEERLQIVRPSLEHLRNHLVESISSGVLARCDEYFLRIRSGLQKFSEQRCWRYTILKENIASERQESDLERINGLFLPAYAFVNSPTWLEVGMPEHMAVRHIVSNILQCECLLQSVHKFNCKASASVYKRTLEVLYTKPTSLGCKPDTSFFGMNESFLLRRYDHAEFFGNLRNKQSFDFRKENGSYVLHDKLREDWVSIGEPQYFLLVKVFAGNAKSKEQSSGAFLFDNQEQMLPMYRVLLYKYYNTGKM